MRIMVFKGGAPGEMKNLVGEYPLEEIGELLGGQVDEKMIQLNRRLAVVRLAQREELPVRYEVAYLGADMAIRGDLVVVHRAMGGDLLRDMTAYDAMDAKGMVRSVAGAEGGTDDGAAEAV